MAERLLRYYKFVADTVGLPGKIQLATETKVPSTRAALEPDSPELLERFSAAVKKITGHPPPADL